MDKRTHGIRQRKSNIDAVFVMTVFLLFACCLLAAVLAFAKVYKSHGDRISARFDKSTAVSLVIQKMHAYDYDGGITTENMDGLDVLCLHETVDGAEYVTYLYSDGENLCELFAAADYPFSTSDGNAVTAADYFGAELKDGIIEFVIGQDGEKASYTYTMRTATTSEIPDSGKAGDTNGG